MATDGENTAPIALIGAGSIGVSWAVVFASAGFPVRLFDTAADSLVAARKSLSLRLDDLDRFGLIGEKSEAILARISMETDLEIAAAGAVHIQENIPEVLGLKRRLLTELSEIAPSDCVIASSSSFIGASKMAQGIRGKERCLVIHPGNPPYLIRVAEVIRRPSHPMIQSNEASACSKRRASCRLGSIARLRGLYSTACKAPCSVKHIVWFVMVWHPSKIST